MPNPTETVPGDATLRTSRAIPASAAEVLAAFSAPERLARWWGPAGFSNTFEVCEFVPGGRWRYTMHGPDGRNFRNESVFAEIEAQRRIVIQHVSKPHYRLTIGLAATAEKTVVSWAQEFESAKIASGLAHAVGPANEQNLDRLTAEVLRAPEPRR
jgi:uncharacterized protein YndB with AHSA1/START domain